MKIRAALLTRVGEPFTIEELDLEAPRARELRVRIAASGVCHSDEHLRTGATPHPLPLVPGHEGAGIVEALGPGVTRARLGDHVVLSWSPACRSCPFCRRGKPNLCLTYTAPIWAGGLLDGTSRLSLRGRPVHHYCALSTFAEQVVVHEESVIPIPRDVPLHLAALVGCAVATGLGSVRLTAGVRPGESAVVVGCGGVGLSVLQGLTLAGASPIIALDRVPEKLAMARRFGAHHALPSDRDAARAVRALTEGLGADYVFEAVGLPALQELGLELTRPGGTLVLVGLSAVGAPTNLPGARITREEKTIKGSYYGSIDPDRNIPEFIELARACRLDLGGLVTKEYALAEINEAYADMLTGQLARGLVRF